MAGSTSRWLRVQFSLRTLFVVTTLGGLALVMFKADRPDLAWLTAIPLAEGFALGEMIPKQKRFDWRAVLKGIVMFPFFVWLVLAVLGLIELVVRPTPNYWEPAALQRFETSWAFLPILALYELPAGTVGIVAGHFLRKVDEADCPDEPPSC